MLSKAFADEPVFRFGLRFCLFPLDFIKHLIFCYVCA